MSIAPLLLTVKKDAETIRITTLKNIIKMLIDRKWLKPENYETNLKYVTSSNNDNQIYKITLDVNLSSLETYDPSPEGTNKQANDEENNTVVIKILPQKVTSILKSPIIGEFISDYKKAHKILVVDTISDKSKLALGSKRMEVFQRAFFMCNLLEVNGSPAYEILTPAEAIKMREEFNVNRNQMRMMLDTDPASLYLYLKVGQIVRVIRNSEATAYAVSYSIIIHKSI